jgi:hypothetical protein
MTSRRDVLKVGAGVGVAAAFASEIAALGQAQQQQSQHGGGRLFSAGELVGSAEVPPVSTSGTGAGVFRLTNDETALEYALLVARVDDATMAHIHLGGEEENGPPVVWLFGSEDDEGTLVAPLEQGVTENGLLATGTITESDLVGPLADSSLTDLVDEMERGNTYVNVHTEVLPGGEVRGQITDVGDVSVRLQTEYVLEASPGGFSTDDLVTLSVNQSRPAEPTPTETPDETPGETPTETPDETPGETPTETPDETPGETPTETPDETPTETLNGTQTESPGG